MNSYFKQKKAMLFQEVVIIAFSLVLTGLFLFLSVSSATSFSGELKILNPELKNEFPSVYVYTFLKQELEKEDKILFFNDENGNYEIKDLIWINNYESIEKLKDYREKYLLETEDYTRKYYLEIFKNNAKNKNFQKENLLKIRETSIPCLVNLKEIENNNSIYYIKSKTNTDITISFEVSTTKSNTAIMCGHIQDLNAKILA